MREALKSKFNSIGLVAAGVVVGHLVMQNYINRHAGELARLQYREAFAQTLADAINKPAQLHESMKSAAKVLYTSIERVPAAMAGFKETVAVEGVSPKLCGLHLEHVKTMMGLHQEIEAYDINNIKQQKIWPAIRDEDEWARDEAVIGIYAASLKPCQPYNKTAKLVPF